MVARKLVYQALTLGPVVMLGFLGVGARANRETFAFDAYGSREQAVVDAYVVPLREAEDLPRRYRAPHARHVARAVASQWVKLLHRGKLQPLPTARGDQREECNAVDQIVACRCRILEALTRCEFAELSARDYHAAVEDILLQMEIAEIAKSTDLQTIYSSALRQELLEQKLRNIAPHLSAGTKLAVAARLAALAREDSDTVSTLYVEQRLRGMRVTTSPAAAVEYTSRLASVPGTVKAVALSRRAMSAPYVTRSPARMFDLAFEAERAHFAGLRSLASEFGWTAPLKVEPRRTRLADIGYGGRDKQAG